jgi:hypothetical protein
MILAALRAMASVREWARLDPSGTKQVPWGTGCRCGPVWAIRLWACLMGTSPGSATWVPGRVTGLGDRVGVCDGVDGRPAPDGAMGQGCWEPHAPGRSQNARGRYRVVARGEQRGDRPDSDTEDRDHAAGRGTRGEGTPGPAVFGAPPVAKLLR